MDSIPARCRDENGYLVRQSLMTDVPYGRRTVARAGCGFLAVYNAARFFGLPVRESEVWQYFHRGVFLGAVMGTTIGHLVPGRVPLRHEDHRGALPRPEKRPGRASCGITRATPATMCWCGGARTGGTPSPIPPRRSRWRFRSFTANM